jgi:hypothetical protein
VCVCVCVCMCVMGVCVCVWCCGVYVSVCLSVCCVCLCVLLVLCLWCVYVVSVCGGACEHKCRSDRKEDEDVTHSFHLTTVRPLSSGVCMCACVCVWSVCAVCVCVCACTWCVGFVWAWGAVCVYVCVCLCGVSGLFVCGECVCCVFLQAVVPLSHTNTTTHTHTHIHPISHTHTCTHPLHPTQNTPYIHTAHTNPEILYACPPVPRLTPVLLLLFDFRHCVHFPSHLLLYLQRVIVPESSKDMRTGC